MKQEGQKPGVPDLVWPIARREHHGLYLELKATKNGRTSPHQKKWLDFLKRQGYRAVVAKGFDIAQAEIMWYAGLSERKSEAIEIDLEKKK